MRTRSSTSARSLDHGDGWEPVQRLTNDPADSWAPSVALDGETVHTPGSTGATGSPTSWTSRQRSTRPSVSSASPLSPRPRPRLLLPPQIPGATRREASACLRRRSRVGARGAVIRKSWRRSSANSNCRRRPGRMAGRSTTFAPPTAAPASNRGRASRTSSAGRCAPPSPSKAIAWSSPGSMSAPTSPISTCSRPAMVASHGAARSA